MSQKIKILASTALLLIGFLISPFFAIPVQAQSGTVCIEPSSTTSCPPPTVLTGPVGTQLRVAVNVENSPGLNGFDISVKTDPSILNPVSFDTIGYIFAGQQFLLVRDCINGVGTACQPGVDGPGVASIAIVAIGFLSPTPTTGRLFAVTYSIVGSSTGTTVGYQTGCTAYPTSNDSFCVTTANGGVPPVPENVQTATFSNASSFSISPNPTSLSFAQGDSGTSTITLTSLGGFSGTVTLSISLSPVVKHNPSTSLSASTVILTSGGSATSTLTVGSHGATTPGSYTLTLTAASASGTGNLQITVTVMAKK